MKLTPAPYRLESQRIGGYTIIVPRPCLRCEASGTIALAKTHQQTRYVNCPVCYGVGYTDAKRECYPFADGVGAWFVLGWPGQRFATPDDAALAVVASFAPADVVEPEPRPFEDVVASVNLDGPR